MTKKIFRCIIKPRIIPNLKKEKKKMKKIALWLLIAVMALSCFACTVTPEETTQAKADETTEAKIEETTEAPDTTVDVMTHEEYMAAEIDAPVVIEAYVQATQSWWDNKITVYLQAEDGAYFAYEMACSEEDAAKLTKGTKIRVSGYKGTWGGEIEIMDGTFEFLVGNWVAEAFDATALLGTDELIAHQNEFVKFTGLTITSISYKNGEPGDDIYVGVSVNGAEYSFCVERYLTGPETEVYQAFASLQAGDYVDMEGFLYWYEGVNTHITSVKKVDVMTKAEYDAAEMDAPVVIEAYVQATQSWWDNKITVYLQAEDGAYFAYEMACSEEDAAKLTKGTKIRVSGYKGTWGGEIEIMDGTFEFLVGNWVAEAFDATALLGTDELIAHQNEFVKFTGLTITSISYKNGEPGDDIYVGVSYNGAEYSFCVERYLTGPGTEVYEAFATLAAGDVVDMEGFLYWYEGVNTHITAVVKK